MGAGTRFAALVLWGMVFLFGALPAAGVQAAMAGKEVVVVPLPSRTAVVRTSVLSIPYTAFSGSNNGLGTILGQGACWLNNGTIIVYLQAPVILPQGAVIKEITVHYYTYYAGDSRAVQLLRMDKNAGTTTMAEVNCDDQHFNHSTTTSIASPTVDNANYSYYLYALGFNCDRKHAIRWVSIKYEETLP